MDAEVNDEPLALGVDRRVRHLGEGLLEVIGGAARHAPVGRRRRVVAHAPERLATVEGHRPEVEAEPLGVQAGEIPTTGRRLGDPKRRAGPTAARRRRPAAADRGSAAVRTEAAAGRGIGQDPAAAGLHEEHLARVPGAASVSISPGASGTAPASEAAATIPARVTA